MSSLAENKEVIRLWFEEVWNHGREDLIESMSAPDVPAAGLAERTPEIRGREMFKRFYRTMRGAFPDLHVKVEEVVAEGDLTVARLSVEGTHTGNSLAPATGRKVKFTGIVMVRIVDGRIAEAWNSLDQLGILTQIGALPENAGPDRFLTPLD